MSVESSNQNAASDFKGSYSTNYNPTVWGYSFLQYASESMKIVDNVELQKVGELEEEVKKMLVSSINIHILSPKLNLIDKVQRLGVSYHFEREIDEALANIHSIYINNHIITLDDDEDLHSLALLFRLLRQQGYSISSDVFEIFKENGNFNEKLADNVEGMLALYEAAQLRVHGEDILDEALEFTSTHLKILTNQLSPSLSAHVNHCLTQPLRKRLRWLEARYYMSFYQQDPSHSDVLLTFAKLGFNMLQKLHQKEIGNITKKKLDFATKVPYARDRLVECYFWPLASYEPQYSAGRTIVAKLYNVMCLVDDTYDTYGTVEELELLTEAIHRWDISPIKSLAECMKVVFEAILEVFSEMESVTAKDGTSSFVMQHVKRAIQNISRAYLVEAKWRDEGYIPTYDEYKVNGVVTSTYPLNITWFFAPAGKFATKEVFDWISRNPKIIRAASLVGRLMDDMASHKFEQERVHVSSAVECCMKQYGISEEEAYKLIHKDIINCWKDINEECLKPHVVPKPVLDCVLNLARVSEVAYENFKDRFTNGELLKDHIVALLVDPIAID